MIHKNLYQLANVVLFQSRVIRAYFITMARCINHLIDRGITFRDIRLQNFILAPDGNVKLVNPHNCRKIPVKVEKFASNNYMAPELLFSPAGVPYDNEKADVYSLGMCLFFLSFQRFPYQPDFRVQKNRQDY